MEQRVEPVFGADFPICTSNANDLTKKLNKEGWKLTSSLSQSEDNKPYKQTNMMLVYTRE